MKLGGILVARWKFRPIYLFIEISGTGIFFIKSVGSFAVSFAGPTELPSI
jgi:hypothetical protein